MFSFKDGILNINIGKSGLDTFVDAGFFVLLCSLFSSYSTEKGENYFYYIGFFAFVGMTVIKLLMSGWMRRTVVLPSFTIWYGGFILLSLASFFWADSPTKSMAVMSRLIQTLVITFCMAQNYSGRSSFLKCMRIFAWSGVFSALYMMVRTPLDTWFSGSFGSEATNMNTNAIGMVFTLCVLVSFYFAFYCKEKKYYIITALEFLIIILTSSRKSLLASSAGLIMLILMHSRKRTLVWRILGVSAFLALLAYLVISVPQLYSAIGIRLESMINHIAGEDGDYSMTLRQMFIEHAADMFYERPLFGYGINNFVYQIGERTGIATYAHNNYYEILADLGIVGFITYYGYYFYLGIAMLRLWHKTNSSMVKLMFTWLVIIMICEYGIVSYYAVYIQVALCCMYGFICAINSEDDHTLGTPSYLKYSNPVYGSDI